MADRKYRKSFDQDISGINSRKLKNLDRQYGKGNWNTTGGKGYAAGGTVKRVNKAGGGYKDQTVYYKLDTNEPKKEKKKSKPKNKQKSTKTQAKAAPVTQPTNQYQDPITDTLAQIGGQNTAQSPAASGTPNSQTANDSDAIAKLTQTIADQNAKHEQDIQNILDQQAAAEEQRKRQAALEEKKRQMEARVASANASRAAADADFRINKDAYEKQRTGTDFFKRRGRLMQSGSDLLQILARNTINI